MKKNVKIILKVIAVVLLVVVLFFVNAFCGNPVSKLLATRTAEKHLAETYPDADYYIEKVGYNFKFSDYYAVIKSPSSIDTVFNLHISMLGKLRLDTYEDVESGFVTARRLDDEYRSITNEIFESEDFPYDADISYGTLEIHQDEYIDGEYDDIPTYAIRQDKLVKDKMYDIRELGAKAGHLVIYVESDTVTVENAAEIMLDIRRIFDKADVPFAAMDFTLEYPLPEGEDIGRPEGYVSVADFRCDDIREERMPERVRKADKALREKYEQMDKEAELYSQEAYSEKAYYQEAYSEQAYSEEVYSEEAYSEEVYTGETEPEVTEPEEVYSEDEYEEYTEETETEDVDVKSLLMAVLDSEKNFITESGNTVLLKDFSISEQDYDERYLAKPVNYTFVDFDGDGAEELVSNISDSFGMYMVFRVVDSEVYGYLFGIRSLLSLKKDGSFVGSGGADLHSYCRMTFEGVGYKIVEEAYKDGFTGTYKLYGEECTLEEIDAFIDQFNAKEGVEWLNK